SPSSGRFAATFSRRRERGWGEGKSQRRTASKFHLKPHAEAIGQRGKGLAQRGGVAVLGEQVLGLFRRGLGVERKNHGLHRADRCSRHRKAAIAERDQRHRL